METISWAKSTPIVIAPRSAAAAATYPGPHPTSNNRIPFSTPTAFINGGMNWRVEVDQTESYLPATFCHPSCSKLAKSLLGELISGRIMFRRARCSLRRGDLRSDPSPSGRPHQKASGSNVRTVQAKGEPRTFPPPAMIYSHSDGSRIGDPPANRSSLHTAAASPDHDPDSTLAPIDV